MRPVERGPAPSLPNGKTKTVRDYKDWRFDLIDRLGYYCCYCNIPLHDSPQVEHVVPKSTATSLSITLGWHNMLLACGACNSIKNNTLCPPATHFLPDYHNTLLAFTHQVVAHPKLPGRMACVVVQKTGLTAAQQLKAKATISLCGLDRIPTTKKHIGRASDLRWMYRYDVWEMAARYRQQWNNVAVGTQVSFLACLADLVQAHGFFSVWFEAFYDVPLAKEMLVAAFSNTAPCFPAPDFDPIMRVAGDL